MAVIGLVIITWQVTPAQTAMLPQYDLATSEVEAALQENETVRVVIRLNAPDLSLMSMNDQRTTVQSLQDSVLNNLAETDFTLKRRFQTLPVLAGEVTAAGLKSLSQNSRVASIALDQPIEAHDTVSLNALQANTVHSEFGVTGQGVTVAVLDTGIDVDHPDFSGRIIAQHCFTDGNCQPGNVDESTIGDDLNGHGTNVAGIVASSGAVSANTKGFAPGANLVAVRVLDQYGGGWASDWLAGLDWIKNNLDTLSVDVINMSLGTNSIYYGSCDDTNPNDSDNTWYTTTSMINQLYNAGVAIFASSGNAGYFNAMSAPGCFTNVIAVGATSDSNLGWQYWFGCYDDTTSLDKITCFTNRNALLDLLAPGAKITSSGMGGGWSTYYGTSQASPTAAGVAALMLEVNPDLTSAQLQQAMQDTGIAIYDSHSGRTYMRIDALKAVQSQTSVIVAGNTVGLVGDTYTFTAVVDPFAATLPITYTWEVAGFATYTSTTPTINTAAYIFSTAGTKTIHLTVTNSLGSFTDTHTIKVFTSLPNKSYLPVALK